MAAGDRVVLDDGTRGRLAAGNSAVLNASSECDECCATCTASGTACTHCSAGDTPTAYTVVFSLVSLCTACQLNDAIVQDIKLAWTGSDVLNTSHTLTQSTSCRWTKTITNAVDVFFYTESTGVCTTPDFGTGFPLTNDLDIVLEKTASNTWVLTVQAGGFLNVYKETFTGDGAGVCETVPASSNGYVGGGTCGDVDGADSEGGYDGSATITCQ